jgi:superfamily II DNA/RNA helicase
MWRARGDATFAKSHALENKPMSDMNQDSAEISAQTPAVNFDSFGLPELMLATLAREGLVSPTPIQEMSIPLLLEGTRSNRPCPNRHRQNRCLFAAFDDASWL